MYDILSLLSVLHPHLSTTTVRQFSRVVLGVLSMTGQVTMRNISRWTSRRRELPDGSTLFSTQLSLGGVFIGCFFARISLIAKVPISWLVMKQSCQNRGHRRMVYILGKRSRV